MRRGRPLLIEAASVSSARGRKVLVRERPSLEYGAVAVEQLGGILAFIFVDMGSHGMAIVETHLTAFKQHDASVWPVIGMFVLLGAGFLAGVGGIATVQRRLTGPSARVRLWPGASPPLA